MLQARVKQYVAIMNQVADKLVQNSIMNKKKTVNNLAKNLNKLMTLSGGMTKAALSRKSGVSERMVAYICNAEKTATIETAEALAEVFGLSGWQIIMPELPDDITHTKATGKVMENYMQSSNEGKDLINMVAERESKYSSNG